MESEAADNEEELRRLRQNVREAMESAQRPLDPSEGGQKSQPSSQPDWAESGLREAAERMNDSGHIASMKVSDASVSASLYSLCRRWVGTTPRGDSVEGLHPAGSTVLQRNLPPELSGDPPQREVDIAEEEKKRMAGLDDIRGCWDDAPSIDELRNEQLLHFRKVKQLKREQYKKRAEWAAQQVEQLRKKFQDGALPNGNARSRQL